jgi:hypothetical protein
MATPETTSTSTSTSTSSSTNSHPRRASAAAAAAAEEHLAVLRELAELRAVREAVSHEGATLRRAKDDAVAKKKQYKELARAAQDEVRRLRADLATRATAGPPAALAAYPPRPQGLASTVKDQALPPSRGALGDRTNAARGV